MYNTLDPKVEKSLLFLTRHNAIILPEPLLVRSILILLSILHIGVPSGPIQRYVGQYPYIYMNDPLRGMRLV